MPNSSDSAKSVPSNLPRLTLYFDPPELKEELERLAKAESRTMSGQIMALIKEAVKKAKEEGRI